MRHPLHADGIEMPVEEEGATGGRGTDAGDEVGTAPERVLELDAEPPLTKDRRECRGDRVLPWPIGGE
jgi:hypothetical protein